MSKTDYKKILKDKKLEAGNLMTEEHFSKCSIAIHTAAVAAAGAGFIPVPVADAIPISAAQVAMVVALGKIFDQQITDSAAKGIIGAAASTLVGRSLVKLIPVVGWAVSAGVAGIITEIIGWTVAIDFAKAYRAEYKRKVASQEAAESFAEAEYYKNAKSVESDAEEVEDFSE